MSTLTIRIPEDKHTRLRALAEKRGISLNKLADELFTVALAQHDTEARFRARSPGISKTTHRIVGQTRPGIKQMKSNAFSASLELVMHVFTPPPDTTRSASSKKAPCPPRPVTP
jgi:hypothetical protein